VIREYRVDRASLLLPERGSLQQSGYFMVAPRVALETVIRLAAVMLGVPVVLLERATIRARLECPKTGNLETHVERVISQPIGRYWKAGRGLAAMAALAEAKV
jgi:hypothetical protein